MTTRLEQRGLLSGRPGRQVLAAALVTALVVVAASVYVWIDLGGGAMYGEARVKEAAFHPPGQAQAHSRLLLRVRKKSVDGLGAFRRIEGRGYSVFHFPT